MSLQMKKTLTIDIDLDKFEPILRFSNMEYQTFVNIGKGLSTREISRLPKMLVSIKTIETHQANMKRKSGLTLSQLRRLACEYVIIAECANIERSNLLPSQVIKTHFKAAA
jgi:DNA-binding NarL/FixJ family response regulator